MKVMIPPIKCQGIKSKLVPFIKQSVDWSFEGKWIEPFMGSGVVGFNIIPRNAVFADSNPHLINFYNAIASGKIDGLKVRKFLEQQGEILSRCGQDYYYEVRERFNKTHEPLDFLFLNRSCFNGMIRFNRKGDFNVPFGHKPQRFAKAYITKIVNQVDYVHVMSRHSNWSFICQDFRETLKDISEGDFVYCDPPYVGRHVDYFDSWDEDNEQYLFETLNQSSCKFILSTWHSNQHRENVFLKTLWSEFNMLTKEHFYHIGAKEENRKPMLEALVMNYTPKHLHEEPTERAEQLLLLEKLTEYQRSERLTS
ncbi:Dam family site-specific DNA-(adenine-N6)-methyltransferase [Candidatus Poribacteria bacterium]|nr:Dam family site-specific DNA-(adenine-N6)-methyltransferase [Candidatus Poribacteria bacterium]MYH83518.1 Dam family site-specific DNA-(adenine-N6)-methyltransferase [Candidatus Poribacteria bacterium]MYK94680.1 Dam family site-specific DNA-(adenine-N6)-methyltransferase [Candidatus Poribacteria bacterium]